MAGNTTTTILLPNGSEFILSQLYTKAEVNGVTVLIVASVISLISVVGLLIALALSAFNTRFSSNEQLFVRTHVAFYFVSLLMCEIIQAIGSIMSAKWVNKMEAFVGPFCTFQAVLKQTADVGAATWATILAIHTFCVLFLEWKPQTYVRWLTLLAGWSFIATIGFAGPATADRVHNGPFHGISGYWCWIANEYETQRLTLDYLIMFLSTFFSFILYSLVFLRLRGNIVISGWHIKFQGVDNDARKKSWSNHNFQERQILIMARQMLLYPVAYTVVILPVAAARFSYFAGQTVPFQVTIFTDTIYLLSGFVNVVLFSTTRRVLPKRTVLKLVISRPAVLEPDYADDPDDYYPDIDDKEISMAPESYYNHSSGELDIEKMGMSGDAGPPTARPIPPVTPIFRRDSSYHSDAGSELEDYYEKKPEHELELELEHEQDQEQEPGHEFEHPSALRPGQSRTTSGEEHEIIDDNGQTYRVPQLQMPDHSVLARRALEPSPLEEHDSDGDSFYGLYDEEEEGSSREGGRGRDSDLPMHDVSLE